MPQSKSKTSKMEALEMEPLIIYIEVNLNTSLKRLAQTYPTSRSSIAPGWKGGKLPPLGGSLGEYSLNDFDEQPAQSRGGVEGGFRGLEEI